MLILDKMRAMDLMVARSERLRVPEEFRWHTRLAADTNVRTVRDEDGRRRLAGVVVLAGSYAATTRVA